MIGLALRGRTMAYATGTDLKGEDENDNINSTSSTSSSVIFWVEINMPGVCKAQTGLGRRVQSVSPNLFLMFRPRKRGLVRYSLHTSQRLQLRLCTIARAGEITFALDVVGVRFSQHN